MNKTVVSPFSSFGKEENGDTIDYHLAQIHTKMKRIPVSYTHLTLPTICSV